MSLRAKLVLWYTAFFAVSGCLLTTGLYVLISRTMQAEGDKFLQEEHEEFCQETLRGLDDLRQVGSAIRAEMSHERQFPLVYRLHDAAAGRDLLALAAEGYTDALSILPPIRREDARSAYASIHFGPRQKPMRVYTAPLDRSRAPGLVLQVGMHNRWWEKRTVSLQKHLALILTGVVLFAAVGGWVLASRSLRPIDRIVTELSRIESANLADRLEVGASGGEVDRLREAINRMLERLHAAFDRLQSFTADAAHELRTPIAALQCRLEVAINKPHSRGEASEALSEILCQVIQLNTLVDDMLFLARMDAQPRLEDIRPVDIGELLRELSEPFALLAEQEGIALSVECPDRLQVEGNAALLRRIFANLLDNAIRYTSSGGQVSARATIEGDRCLVTVADTGIGIEPDALPHLFDRFYRADASRSRSAGGAGLGLSIVKRAVELHQGTIDIQSQPGRGTAARVWLPSRVAPIPGGV